MTFLWKPNKIHPPPCCTLCLFNLAWLHVKNMRESWCWPIKGTRVTHLGALEIHEILSALVWLQRKRLHQIYETERLVNRISLISREVNERQLGSRVSSECVCGGVWARPLPQELVKYAREDTHYLLYIYDCLKNQLLERGNEQANLLHATLQRSTQLCLHRYTKPIFVEDGYVDALRKARKAFNSQQEAGLRGLYSWRDRCARLEDESTGLVLISTTCVSSKLVTCNFF